METKFFDSLFCGDSYKGAILCLGLTEGDFWTRTKGCMTLYRGAELDNIDYDYPLDIFKADAEKLCLGGDIIHDPARRYYYQLRTVNGLGDEPESFDAGLRIDFGGEGDVIGNYHSSVYNLSARQISADTVELIWRYQQIYKTRPARFNIYSDGGADSIDFSAAVKTARCLGGGIYSACISGLSSGQKYTFAVTAVFEDAAESGQFASVSIMLSGNTPDSYSLI